MPTDGNTHGALRLAFMQAISANRESLQSGTLLIEVRSRLSHDGIRVPDVAILTTFSDLMRVGYVGWGKDMMNSGPPWLHVTDLGRTALERMSRDPANPDGYMAYLKQQCALDAVAESYIREGLNTFNAACFRATAVMVGAAAEQLVLGIRDAIIESSRRKGAPIPKNLDNWKVTQVLEAIEVHVLANRSGMDRQLFEEFDAHWSSFSGQIRLARNSAGHPSGIESVESATSHASLLIFPELARLAARLQVWINA